MKALITGIAGFVGSHLARECQRWGWQVTGIDSMIGGDARNVPKGVIWRQTDCAHSSTWEDLIRDTDVVFHCAATAYEGLSVFSPELVYENTLMASVSVARASVAANVRRLVFCSSMSRYGSQPTPYTEDMPVRPQDPYACAKVGAEEAIRSICGLHGVEYVIAVPHNIYGPGQRYWDPFRNVAAIMVNRVLLGRPPVIYGDGSQRRCLSYISDVIDPLMALATRDVAGEVFNIGPDDPGVTITTLARLVLKATESSLEPVHFPPRPAEVHTATCSAAKARRVLGYRPEVPLEDGLAHLVEWVQAMGPRPFDYHLPIELPGPCVPRTWADQLM